MFIVAAPGVPRRQLVQGSQRQLAQPGLLGQQPLLEGGGVAHVKAGQKVALVHINRFLKGVNFR